MLCQLHLPVGLPVGQVGDQQQSQYHEEDDGGKGVHLRRHGFLGHVVDADGQGLEAVARGEIADDEVVQREGEGHDGPGDDARQDLRDLDLPEGPHRGAAQVHGGFRQGFVHLLELGQHLQDDIRRAEGHVGDEHGEKAQACRRAEQAADKDEHQHQRDAGDDIRVRHGDVCDGVHHGPVPFRAQLVDADGGCGADDGGDGRSRGGQQQGVFDRFQGIAVPQQLPVPVQGETGEDRQALALVKREDQQDDDGREQEAEDDAAVNFGRKLHLISLHIRAWW